MTRHHTCRTAVIWMSLLATLAHSQEQDAMKEARDAVTQATDEAVEAVKQNYERFVEDNTVPLDKARKTLIRKVTDLNLAKKTKEAKYVQDAIGEFEKTVLSRAVPVTLPSKPIAKQADKPLPPQKPMLERMIGEWYQPARGEKRFFDATGRFRQVSAKGVEELPPTQAQVKNERVTWGGYANKGRAEAWLVADDVMAFLFYDANGSLINDGELWFRKK